MVVYVNYFTLSVVIMSSYIFLTNGHYFASYDGTPKPANTYGGKCSNGASRSLWDGNAYAGPDPDTEVLCCYCIGSWGTGATVHAFYTVHALHISFTV